MNPRTIEEHKAMWRGIDLIVTFERNWLSSVRPITAHLTITTAPERQPLPITETGYRSHFLPAHAVDDEGGPVAFVLAWLDHEAASPEWKAAELSARQLSLF